MALNENKNRGVSVKKNNERSWDPRSSLSVELRIRNDTQLAFINLTSFKMGHLHFTREIEI